MNQNDILRTVLAASVAGVSMPGAAVAGEPILHAIDLFGLYDNSEYGYCDAMKIAHVWGQSVEQAKATLGQKVRDGLEDLADADIASTSGSVACSWWDSGLTYEDADRLAEYWGQDVDAAKAKVATLMSESGHKKFVQRFASVLYPEGDDEEYIPRADLLEYEAYVAGGYGYCDAKKMAHVWGQSIGEAKLTLGAKVRAGLEDLADTDIASTAHTVSCDWSETDLTYEDAEQLAAYWGESIEDAKAKAVTLMSARGHKDFMLEFGGVLNEAGVGIDGGGDLDYTAYDAYAESGYGYCDAKKIAHVWGSSDAYQGKIILGNKVLDGLEAIADQDIASTRGTVRCVWEELELTYDDAETLGEHWGISTWDSKLKAADMVSDVGFKQFMNSMKDVL